jgi:DNA repair ATPase RecN
MKKHGTDNNINLKELEDTIINIFKEQIPETYKISSEEITKIIDEKFKNNNKLFGSDDSFFGKLEDASDLFKTLSDTLINIKNNDNIVDTLQNEIDLKNESIKSMNEYINTMERLSKSHKDYFDNLKNNVDSLIKEDFRRYYK